MGAHFRARVASAEAPASFNIAPSMQVLVVRVDARSNERTLDSLQWGLIPYFAKDRKVAWKHINARAETVATQPSYRAAFAKRRCLIVANGFFEWARDKQPYAYALKSREPLAFAGLWENWKDPATQAWLRSCTIITTSPNELVRPVHDRMPVILDPADYARWLGEVPADAPALNALLKPLPDDALVSWPVSRALNKAGETDEASLLDEVQTS
jgi:putative SOS response-associated peptidase YedK